MIKVTKKLFLTGDVSTDMLEKVTNYVDDDENDRLTINIHSPGGDGDSAMAIYDYIKLSKKPTTTIVLGRAESAALIILAAGTTRKATKNSIFMTHLPVCDDKIKKNFLKKKDLRIDKLSYFLPNFFKIMSELGIKDIRKEKFYFNVDDALKFGTIHSICS